MPGVATMQSNTNCSVPFNVPFNVPSVALWGLVRFVNLTVKKPLFSNSGSGKPASFISLRIRGTPEPTFSTMCIRVNSPNMSGLRLMLFAPKFSATNGRRPPGLDISTRSSYTSTMIVAPSSYRSRWQMALHKASLNASRGIYHISFRGSTPSMIYSTSNLLSIHEIALRYC